MTFVVNGKPLANKLNSTIVTLAPPPKHQNDTTNKTFLAKLNLAILKGQTESSNRDKFTCSAANKIGVSTSNELFVDYNKKEKEEEESDDENNNNKNYDKDEKCEFATCAASASMKPSQRIVPKRQSQRQTNKLELI